MQCLKTTSLVHIGKCIVDSNEVKTLNITSVLITKAKVEYINYAKRSVKWRLYSLNILQKKTKHKQKPQYPQTHRYKNKTYSMFLEILSYCFCNILCILCKLQSTQQMLYHQHTLKVQVQYYNLHSAQTHRHTETVIWYVS